MPDAILDALAPVLTRWTMGGTAAALAPPAWSAAAGADPRDAELRLLALTGHFLATAVLREPPALTILPDLPRLALPPVPTPLRPLVRRTLRTHGPGDLLVFLAARGCSLHPGDWLPGPGDHDVPALYAPWRDWAETAPGPRRALGEIPTPDTWNDWGPSARRAAIAALRRRDPAAALALIVACAGGEPAETRTRLVEILADQLSDADRPYLEGLAGDRAPRVKALAAALLARLGHTATAGAEASELAALFTLKTRGLLRRSQTITANPLKTPAQRLARETLFDAVDLAAFAAALSLTVEALIAAWPPGDDAAADAALARMVARSGTDAAVAGLLAALVDANPLAIGQILILTPRLDPVQRRALGAHAAGAKRLPFIMVLQIAGAGADLDHLIDMTAGTALLASAVPTAELKHPAAAAELHALGLLASQAAASDALTQLTAAGLLAADPRLDTLRLNAALPHGA